MILALAFTITFGWWLLPAAITLFAFYRVFTIGSQTSAGSSYFDFSFLAVIFELGWFIPAFFAWAVYFAVLYFTK